MDTTKSGSGGKGNPPLLHEAQAAKLLAVSSAWLQRKRWEGGGPAYIRHGRAIRYEQAAIDEWISSHRIPPARRDAR